MPYQDINVGVFFFVLLFFSFIKWCWSFDNCIINHIGYQFDVMYILSEEITTDIGISFLSFKIYLFLPILLLYVGLCRHSSQRRLYRYIIDGLPGPDNAIWLF